MQVIRETVNAPGCVTSVFHPTPPCQSPLLLLLLARLLLLRLFNRIVLASDSCGVGNKIQNAKKQTRRNLYIGPVPP